MSKESETKYFPKCKKMKQNWTGTENVNIYSSNVFLVIAKN